MLVGTTGLWSPGLGTIEEDSLCGSAWTFTQVLLIPLSPSTSPASDQTLLVALSRAPSPEQALGWAPAHPAASLLSSPPVPPQPQSFGEHLPGMLNKNCLSGSADLLHTSLKSEAAWPDRAYPTGKQQSPSQPKVRTTSCSFLWARVAQKSAQLCHWPASLH